MKKVAFLFPGQGAQYVGMGKDFFDSFAIVKRTFEEAEDFLSYKLSDIGFQGPVSTLTMTKYAQVAIYVKSVSLLRLLEEQFPDLQPEVCAGLSLGEYTALFASKRYSFLDGLFLVQKRAEAMNEACERTTGTMAAVLGLENEIVEQVIASLQPTVPVWAANFNCPHQVVISGTKEGIERGILALKEKGAKKVIPLQVHGAFHSGLMQSAKEKLVSLIQSCPLVVGDIDLVMNFPGDYISSLEDMKSALAEQVTGSIRWEQSIRSMERKGIEGYIEIGCGKVLSGFNRKIGVKGKTLSIEKVEDLEQLEKECQSCC
ncbi:MAG: ACP S-malonyltransferase [Chlamydiota bacterium]